MKFLIAAWYEFLKNIRDIKMIAFMVVFPVVVSYLVGSAVSGFFQPDDGKAIETAYVNLDKGMAGQAFDQFINEKQVSDRLAATPYTSLDEGKKALSDGKCTVVIYLPADLSTRVLQGSGGKIELYGDNDVEFVDALAGSFTSAFSANLAAAGVSGGPVQAERVSAVARVNRTKNGEFPKLTDYYAVLVLLQALVIGAIFGAYITSRNYGSDIHIRIHALPVNAWTLLFGRIVGSVAYLLLTSAVTILFTKYAYGVDWGGNLPVMIGTLAVFSFTVVGLGVISGRLCKKTSTAIMVVFALMFIFGTISGSVSPRSGVTALGFLTPNYYAKILLFGTIYGYPAQTMIQSGLLLLGFAAVVGTAIVLLMRRVQYDNL